MSTLIFLPILWLIFCSNQQNVNILMTMAPAVNMITTQVIPFFSSNLWALSVGIFHFNISVQFSRLRYVLVSKLHIYITAKTTFSPEMTISISLTLIYFFKIKFANLWYMFCPQFDNDMIPIPWTNVKLH